MLSEHEKEAQVVALFEDMEKWSGECRTQYQSDSMSRTKIMNIESLFYLVQKLVERRICNLSLRNREAIYFESGLSISETNEKNIKNVKVEGSFENGLRTINKIMLDDMVFYLPKWVKGHPDYKKGSKIPVLDINSVIDSDEKMNEKIKSGQIKGKEASFHVLNQLTYLKQIRNAHVFGDLLSKNINEINDMMGATLRNMSQDTQESFVKELFESFTSPSGFYNILDILVEDAAYQKNSNVCEMYMNKLGDLIKSSCEKEGERDLMIMNVANSIDTLRESLSIINLDGVFVNYIKGLKSYKDVEETAVKVIDTEDERIHKILIDYNSLMLGEKLFKMKGEFSEEEKNLPYTGLLYEGNYEKVLRNKSVFDKNFIFNLDKTIRGLNSVLETKIDSQRGFGQNGDVVYSNNVCVHIILKDIGKEDSDFLKKMMNKMLLVESLAYEKEIAPLVDEYLMEKELNKNKARLDRNQKTKSLKF